MMTVYIMNLKNITHGQVSAVKKITIKDGHAFSKEPKNLFIGMSVKYIPRKILAICF